MKLNSILTFHFCQNKISISISISINGNITARYNRDKLLYKRRLREDQARETTVFTNELHEALLRKSGRQFWNVWNSKFESKSHRIIQVDNSVDRTVIMDNFAQHFECLYAPSNHTRNEELIAKYDRLKEHYLVGLTDDDRVFDVALISKLVSDLKNGRAPGCASQVYSSYCYYNIIQTV